MEAGIKMSNSFGEYFRDLRKELNLTQEELAEKLSLHPVVIQKWETGESVPTSIKIRRAGQTLNLETEEINELLELANYPRLSTQEIRMPYFPGRDEEIRKLLNQSHEFLDSPRTSIGGTIENLGGRIQTIENSLGAIRVALQGADINVLKNIPFTIEKNIEPLRQEIIEIRDNILPQLEETQDQFMDYEKFVRENAEFLKSAVEAQGLLKSLQGQLDSFEKRLANIETQINLRRTRTIAIISTTIAIVSLGILIYQNFFM